jgi:hypothetical protein
MHPSPSAETCGPLRPSVRCFIEDGLGPEPAVPFQPNASLRPLVVFAAFQVSDVTQGG